MMSRVIFHVDMDAFFVSVEINENPKLKGRPVVVGANPKKGKGRGVVSTCSYEARKYGIHSGMPISHAYKLCPDAIFLPVRMGIYKEKSRKIMSILKNYAGKIEQVSVDEAFLDMSEKVSDFEEAKRKAKKIKREIREKENLTCSIGVGPNKLIAKIASDYDKPDGLTTVQGEGAKRFLYPMPVKKLYGVGPKTEKKLRNLGIETIGQLSRFDKQKLIKIFGKMGIQLHRYANGIDESPVKEERKIKSIGREHTFKKDTKDKDKIFSNLEGLSERVKKDIDKERFSFKTIVVKIRYSNFDTHTKQTTFREYKNDLKTIKEKSKGILKEFLNGGLVRLLGIRVTNLKKREKTLKDF